MLTIDASPDGATLTFKPDGRFDGKIHREFQDAFGLRAKPASHYVVDFGRTDYIDSSGLGMLLKLRAHAEIGRAHV